METQQLAPFPQVLIWNLDIGEPVKMIDCHTDVILCMSFNTDGSLLATTCKDKKLRVVEPRSGRVLQVWCSLMQHGTGGSWGGNLLKRVKTFPRSCTPSRCDILPLSAGGSLMVV